MHQLISCFISVRLPLLITLVFLVCCQCMNAQDSLPGMSIKQLIRQGNKDFKQGYYYDAINYYMEVLLRDSNKQEVFLPTGIANFKIRDYKQALKWFSKSVAADKNCITEALYYKGLVNKMLGNCKTAVEDFKLFTTCYKGKNNQVKDWVATDIFGCIQKLPENDDSIFIEHLPQHINSGYSELSPVVANSQLFYTSIHSDTLVYLKSDTSYVQPSMQVYYSKIVDGTFDPPKAFTELDMPDKNIVNISFNKKEKKELFFTVCNGELQQNNCAIWHALADESGWKYMRELSEKINFNTYSSTHPYISYLPDGREILWFSSNQPGGQGGFDIWFSERQADGKFKKPQNAGIAINTSRDEVTPFFDQVNSTLYFSSSGLVGRGGLDIFFSKVSGGKFSLPQSLLDPINSTYDESFFVLTDFSKGYFVSNRPGVFSVKGETCCDDIFAFERRKAVKPWLKLSAVDTNGNIIPFTRFIIKNETYSVIEDKVKSTLFHQLPSNGTYKIVSSKDGFFSVEKSIAIGAFSSTDTNEIAVVMNAVEINKVYSISNIYFDFNSATLNVISQQSLDSLSTFLKQNLKLKIEIGSHTDARGDDNFNLTLSQQRAEAVVKFLIDRGINSNRLLAKGYGETQLLKDCSGISECEVEDCDCHQQNRRTEFKILE